MNERLKAVREQLSLTLKEMGESISTSAGHLSDMEHGRKNISGRTIDLICMRFNVSKEWFVLGNGDMFLEVSREEEIAAFMGDMLSVEDMTFKKALITALSRLDEEQWALIEKFAIDLSNLVQ